MIILLILLALIDAPDQDVIAFDKSCTFVTEHVNKLKCSVERLPDFHDATVTSNGCYIIESFVVVKNAAGELKHKNYRCILLKDGDEWKCASVDLFR